MKNVSIPVKLWLVVGLFAVGIGIVSVAGLTSAGKISDSMAKVTGGSVPRMEQLGLIGMQARQVRTREFQFLAATTDEKRADLLKGIEEAADKAQEGIDKYQTLAKDPADKANIDKLDTVWNDYRTKAKALEATRTTKGHAAAFELLDKTVRPIFVKEFTGLFEEIGTWNNKEANKLHEQGVSLRQTSTTLIIILSLCCISLGAGLAWTTIKGITGGVGRLMTSLENLKNQEMQELTEAMQAMENADLTKKVSLNIRPLPVEGKDEIARMSGTFNLLQGQIQEAISYYDAARISLGQLVSSVRENADRVAESSRTLAESTDQSGRSASEIASGSEKLATSALDAAASMERFRFAIQEIEAGSVKQANTVSLANSNLEEAKHAVDEVSAAAKEMASVAQEGGQAVKETVASMESIREQVEMTAEKVRDLDEKGQQIGQIVSTIEAIAEQTNLLALNAAIEAARAGDHGRGFAVVADEVRKLAEQSSSATKEIGSLIESVRSTVSQTVQAIEVAQTRVDAGTEQSQTAGESLKKIVGSAASVAGQLSDVAQAANGLEVAMEEVHIATSRAAELTATVSQDSVSVSGAIEEVASISQETAAGSEEMSASTEEVAASASELNTLALKLRESVSSFQVEQEKSPVTYRIAA